jgi:hypothetical protein
MKNTLSTLNEMTTILFLVNTFQEKLGEIGVIRDEPGKKLRKRNCNY